MFFYRIISRVVFGCLPFLSLFSSRIKKFYKGHLRSKPPILRAGNNIWFHCASYGEYEGIAPLLVHYRGQSHCTTILSFYSPSGFDHTFDQTIADHICYAPLDMKKRVSLFIKSIQASVLVVSQNDYWPNMIAECQKMSIPVYFIGTYIRHDHWWLRKISNTVTAPLKDHAALLLQDEVSFQLLQQAGFKNLSVIGNPRIVQATYTKENLKKFPYLTSFTRVKPCIVWGSTLDSDHRVIAAALPDLSSYNMLIVPHEIDESELKQVQAYFPSAIRYSSLSMEQHIKTNIIIVDTMGDLKYMYQYATVAYVGGGFQRGTHSVIEPAVFNIPVICGPNINKFIDAKHLANIGVLHVVNNATELIAQIKAVENGLTDNSLDNLRLYIKNNLVDIVEISRIIDLSLEP